MQRISTGLVLAAMTVLGSACSRQAVVESGPAVDSNEVTARGTVRRLGSEGAVRTVIQGAESTVVLGDYEDEIGRIAGAEVWVSGVAETSAYGPAIRASTYRILSVDGEIPVVGVLAEDPDGFYVVRDDGSIVRLDVSERLAAARGAKVWVVLGADGVTVNRYGILRD
jgi:hypothetical protein